MNEQIPKNKYEALSVEELVEAQRKSGNPIFREAFENVPDDYVGVYRFVRAVDLERIGESGVIARGSRETFASKQVRMIDYYFDKFAPSGYSRSGAILAHPDEPGSYFQDPDTPIKLELRIDPEQALVADGEWVTSFVSMSRTVPAERYAEGYWRQAITLKEYLSLALEQRQDEFQMPEVIIPTAIMPEQIRFVGIYRK